jgi:hypothetical protein
MVVIHGQSEGLTCEGMDLVFRLVAQVANTALGFEEGVILILSDPKVTGKVPATAMLLPLAPHVVHGAKTPARLTLIASWFDAWGLGAVELLLIVTVAHPVPAHRSF